MGQDIYPWTRDRFEGLLTEEAKRFRDRSILPSLPQPEAGGTVDSVVDRVKFLRNEVRRLASLQEELETLERMLDAVGKKP